MRENRYNGCVTATYHYSPMAATPPDRNNVTLLQSAGTGLSKTSPHCSDNFHGRLYATMPTEYALELPDMTG